MASAEMDDFEIPLSSPFTWKPAKLIKFWNSCHNHIKHVFENGEIATDSEITRFRHTMDDNGRNRQVFRPGNNWKDVLGPYHYELVTKTEKGVQTWWPTSLVTLLRMIRNKHEHKDGLSNEEKLNLGWFRVVDEKLQFDENMFVSYWTRKFPHLMPFLWSEFKVFKQVLREFYPECLDTSKINLGVDIIDFVTLLNEACIRQVDKGFLHSRYTMESAGGRVELRILRCDLLVRVLDGSSSFIIIVSSEGLHLKWNGSELVHKIVPKTVKKWDDENVGTFIFANGSNQMDENLILRNFSTANNYDKRIVIFTSEDAVESLAVKFSNKGKIKILPVKWGDLSEKKQESILSGNKFLVKLNSNELRFKNLIPEDGENGLKILNKLEGKVLNKLLRTHSMQILTKHQLPKLEQFYKKRRFYNRARLNSIILSQTFQDDVIVVVNSYGKISIPESVNRTVLKSEDVFPKLKLDDPNCTVIQVKSEIQDLSNLLKIFEGWESEKINKNIHFLEYIDKDTLKWRFTHGSISSVHWKFENASKKTKEMSESQFLQSLAGYQSEKMIFISDQPGMGKTQALISLARGMMKMTGKKKKHIIKLFTLHEYVKALIAVLSLKSEDEQDDICVNDVISSIVALTCSNKFEEAIITHLLSPSSCKLKFELLLDGLDELNFDSRMLALEALQIMKNEFPSNVRVWVTLRDHMLDDICTDFGTLGYKLDPFSKPEQVQFILLLWCRSFERRGKLSDFHRPEFLPVCIAFAAKCAQNFLLEEDAQFAGIPLQCRMIAEIFEGHVLLENFQVENHTRFMLTDLYEKMMKRKLEIYLGEKKSLPVSISSEDCIVKVLDTTISRYLTYLSIKLVLSEEIADKVKTFLYIPDDPLEIETLSKMVLEHGIIQSISPLKFVHRTFAEYLIAKFACEFLLRHFRNNDNQDIDLIHPAFQDFLWDGILATQFEYPLVEFQHETLCVFLNFLLPQVIHLVYNLDNDKEITLSAYMIIFEVHVSGSALLRPSKRNLRHGSHFLACCRPFDKTRSPTIGTRTQILHLLALSRKHLSSLFIWAVLMKCDALMKLLISQMGISPELWYGLQEFDELCKFGIFHQLLIPIDCNEVEIPKLKYWIEHFFKGDPTLLEQKDASGKTPLLFLTKFGLIFRRGGKATVELLRLLINELGADVNAIDDDGNSAFHIGKVGREEDILTEETQVLEFIQEQKMYFKIICFLSDNGCYLYNLNVFNKYECTPFLAFLEIQMEAYEYAMEKGWKSSGLLHYMILEAIKFFKMQGTDYNSRDSDGGTTLHKVIKKGYPLSIVRNLIENGVDLSVKNFKGQCPIHLAVEMGDLHLVKVLIGECPSSIYVKDGEGKTILQYETTHMIRKYIQWKVNVEI